MRVGCFVFAETVMDLMDYYVSHDTTGTFSDRWHGYSGVLALLAAHEIGHAMGIAYYMDGSFETVMSPHSLDCMLGNIDMSYGDFDEFDGQELNVLEFSGHVFPEKKCSVNLRDLLGVTTVDIGS